MRHSVRLSDFALPEIRSRIVTCHENMERNMPSFSTNECDLVDITVSNQTRLSGSVGNIVI